MFRRVHVNACLGVSTASSCQQRAGTIGTSLGCRHRWNKQFFSIALVLPGAENALSGCQLRKIVKHYPKGVQCHTQSCLPKPLSCYTQSSSRAPRGTAVPANSSRPSWRCRGSTPIASMPQRFGMRPKVVASVLAARHVGNGYAQAHSRIPAIHVARTLACCTIDGRAPALFAERHDRFETVWTARGIVSRPLCR